ncbi:MAG: CHASE domain-containing protein, partial [Syntrophales bacterium]|nr:CHASE domain-containing protein [Syntrophales bacterium]
MIQSPLKNKSLRRAVIAALLALILLLPFWWWIGLWYQGKLLTEKRAQIGEFLAVQGRSLGTEINGRLAILKALKTFVDGRVGAGQEISAVEFAAYAAGLFSGESGVHSLSIAPDGITQFLFPSGSSESLAGHDLIRDPRHQIRTDVQRAVRSRRIVISGPYALRPKGLGLVARQAVYANENLWGLISLVLDLPPILAQAGLDSTPSGLEIALLDRSDRLFFGKKAALEGNPISFQVDLPDGTWKLAALPAGGWSTAVERPLLQFRGLTLALAFLTAMLIGLAAGYQMQVTTAVRQRTGSLQRSLTDRR